MTELERRRRTSARRDRRVLREMPIDDPWTLREERGFTWWGAGIRQRVWTTGRPSHGETLWHVRARTPVFRDLTDTRQPRQYVALPVTGSVGIPVGRAHRAGRERPACGHGRARASRRSTGSAGPDHTRWRIQAPHHVKPRSSRSVHGSSICISRWMSRSAAIPRSFDRCFESLLFNPSPIEPGRGTVPAGDTRPVAVPSSSRDSRALWIGAAVRRPCGGDGPRTPLRFARDDYLRLL